jgi:hypothetical protein
MNRLKILKRFETCCYMQHRIMKEIEARRGRKTNQHSQGLAQDSAIGLNTKGEDIGNYTESRYLCSNFLDFQIAKTMRSGTQTAEANSPIPTSDSDDDFELKSISSGDVKTFVTEPKLEKRRKGRICREMQMNASSNDTEHEGGG